jgi:hypothetical protein
MRDAISGFARPTDAHKAGKIHTAHDFVLRSMLLELSNIGLEICES